MVVGVRMSNIFIHTHNMYTCEMCIYPVIQPEMCVRSTERSGFLSSREEIKTPCPYIVLQLIS